MHGLNIGTNTGRATEKIGSNPKSTQENAQHGEQQFNDQSLQLNVSCYHKHFIGGI